MRHHADSKPSRADRLKERLRRAEKSRDPTPVRAGPARALAHVLMTVTLLRNLTFLIIAVAAIAFVWHEVRDESVYLEPIRVPAAMADLGVSEAALTALVVDRVGRIAVELQDIHDIPSLEVRATTDLPEVRLLTMAPSVQVIGRALRRLLGYRDNRIEGNVSRSSSGWHLSIRDPSSHLASNAEISDEAPLPKAIVEAAALGVLRLVNPSLLLQYQYWRFYTARDAASLEQVEATLSFLEGVAGGRGDREVRKYRGFLSIWRRDFATAHEIFLGLARDYPAENRFRLRAASASLEMGRADEGNAAIDEILKANESNPSLLAVAGELALDLGRFRDALDLSSRNSLTVSTDEALWWCAAESLNGLHRPREAIALLDGWAMKSVDWFISQQATLADSYAATKDVANLERIRALLMREHPESHDSWRVAAQLAELQGHVAEARIWYERIASRKLGGESVTPRIADLLAREGKLDAALPMIESYREGHPWNAEALNIHARVLAMAGQMTRADAAYAKLLARDPDNVTAWQEWSDLLARMGRADDSMVKKASAAAAEKRLSVPLDRPRFQRPQQSLQAGK